MPRITQHDAIKAWLEDRGYAQHPDPRTQKYTQMVTASHLSANSYFIGKAGAMRRGRTVTGSFPVADTVRHYAIKHGRELLQKRAK